MITNKRRFWLWLFICCGVALCFTAPAAAHVQANDSGVSAIMHILPDDRPVAGEPTLIQFSFGGSSRAFSIMTCDCTLTVSKDNQIVSKTVLEPVDASSERGQVSVTFPASGAYVLTLSGSAETTFNMPFRVRVSAAAGKAERQHSGIDVILLGVTSVVTIGVLAYYNISSGLRYTSPSTPKKSRTLS